MIIIRFILKKVDGVINTDNGNEFLSLFHPARGVSCIALEAYLVILTQKSFFQYLDKLLMQRVWLLEFCFIYTTISVSY